MIATIFRSRLRPEYMQEYAGLAEKILELAKTMPGFVSFKSYEAKDGERVSIVEFADWETHNVWKDQSSHQMAQKLGREKFYAWFRIQVCVQEKNMEWKFSE
ncbi:MAG: antibiotic biosynthesis monooxygenase [Chthoniobacterales bacterium]